MGTWTWAGYYFLWIIAMNVVPERKKQNGYIWRGLRATMFRWILSQKPPKQMMRRFLTFSFALWAITEPFLNEPISGSLFYTLLIVMELDDYLNGDDDDRKKRWEAVKNKIKWLMDLPPKPAEGQVQS